jgi:hypothetical protein
MPGIAIPSTCRLPLTHPPCTSRRLRSAATRRVRVHRPGWVAGGSPQRVIEPVVHGRLRDGHQHLFRCAARRTVSPTRAPCFRCPWRRSFGPGLLLAGLCVVIEARFRGTTAVRGQLSEKVLACARYQSASARSCFPPSSGSRMVSSRRLHSRAVRFRSIRSFAALQATLVPDHSTGPAPTWPGSATRC